MSAINVRPLVEADHEQYFDILSLTYNSGDPIPEDRKEFKWHRAFVAEQEGEIKGIFNILDLTCTRGPALLNCGGVAAVGVMPHGRRSGVGRAMMEGWIRRGREEGVQMSSLYAFSERYYRQFGYEVVGKRIKITCPTEQMPTVKTNLEIRRLKPSDWQELEFCYRAFAHARSGFSMRDEKLWLRVLGEHRQLTIYAAGNPVQAYAVVSHSTEFNATDHISEIAWATKEGYDALFAVLRGISINKKGLSWYEPSDSPFMSRYLDRSTSTEIVRPIMFRVNDVPGAIEKLTLKEFEPFSILVHDDLIEENRGPWLVEQGKVSKVDHADIEADIRQFAQVLLGDPSLVDLARNGLVKINEPRALLEATKVFPAMPVYCPEFF